MKKYNLIKGRYWEQKSLSSKDDKGVKEWQKPFQEATEKAARRTEREQGEKIPRGNVEKMIGNYLDRWERIEEQRGGLLRRFLERKYIIKPENITDDYIRNVLLGNYAELKGYDREKLANAEVKAQIGKMFEQETGKNPSNFSISKKEKIDEQERIVADQKASLNGWLDYLGGEEAKENYPREFRYWAMAEVVKLGAQNKDKLDYTKRDQYTAAPFPELNQQALAKVFDEVKRKLEKEPSQIGLNEEKKREEYEKRLKGMNFGKLYGWMIDYINSLKLPMERLPITQGEWKKFAKNSDPKELTRTIQGFNTGWCIAGEGTAGSYLKNQDIWIYYSADQEGQNSIPRAAVVTDGSKVLEVRGIIQTREVKQHLDDYIAPVVEKKLKELPGGEEWKAGMEDMKYLAEIHFKHMQKKPFDKSDLEFVYELDHPIRSMGYGKDPRIEEIRETRDLEADILTVFDCQSNEIVHSPEELNQNTKAYVGKWNVDVWQKVKEYPNIKHLFESFPDKKIFMRKLTTDPNVDSPQSAKEALESKNIYVADWAKDILAKTKFNPEKREYELVRFTVADLGFPDGATTAEIIGTKNDKDDNGQPAPFTRGRMTELGLYLCPAEVGPHLRLQNSSQDWMLIAMEPIIGSGGAPSVFRLHYGGGRLELDAYYAGPDEHWLSAYLWVFSARKFDT